MRWALVLLHILKDIRFLHLLCKYTLIMTNENMFNESNVYMFW